MKYLRVNFKLKHRQLSHIIRPAFLAVDELAVMCSTLFFCVFGIVAALGIV